MPVAREQGSLHMGAGAISLITAVATVLLGLVVTAKDLDEAERLRIAEGAAALIHKQGSTREEVFGHIREVVERLETVTEARAEVSKD